MIRFVIKSLMLMGVLLLGGAVPVMGQQSWAETTDFDYFNRPRRQPDIFTEGYTIMDQGFRFGIGAPRLELNSDLLGIQGLAISDFTSGILVNAEWQFSGQSFGYSRLIGRIPLPAGTTYNGLTATFLGFESDQLWAQFGGEVFPGTLFHAAFGVQWRQSHFHDSNSPDTIQRLEEATGILGVQMEIRIAPPFVVVWRYMVEDVTGIYRLTGDTLSLNFVVPL